MEQINQSSVKILFVGLGCPKQEIWMAAHSGKVKAVMLGVGAAFDFHAGIKRQAPIWMQNIGLEWLFRLFTEPRRLWKRYFYHNPRFVLLAIADLLGLLKKGY
jgi:N-acetylglucosaminyldiphosphoundecaprenol N-acetyl-beta-D-mannosaminyltransferase